MKFLLLQVRNPDDPMRQHERMAFARTIHCDVADISVLDLLTETISSERLDGIDVVLLGGSGEYSACAEDPWLLRSLDGLRLLYELRRPVFASCWGFQALARALGGTVIHDPSRIEVGTHRLNLTPQGKRDPLFGSLSDPFWAQMGHEDHVTLLPPQAVLLASSDRSRHQAYTFRDRPIYATQFHPELRAADLMIRVQRYPEYLAKVTGMTLEQFRDQLRDTDDSAALLRRFIAQLRRH
jgi:GMP synthase (glutamine-hydrolysing)